jgi:hypothetical protein
MKSRTLLFLFSFCAFSAFSQSKNGIIGIYGGGGLATSDNYNVAISGGLDFQKGVFYRSFLGFDLFYQQYGLSYDNEANGAKNGSGSAGVSILNKSGYIFFAPKFSVGMRETQNVKLYITAGVGYNMSGTETLRKWEYRYTNTSGNYDSTIDATPDINKLLFRIGIGMTEYIKMRGKWWFTLTEDLGFITSNLSTLANTDNPNRTEFSPHNLSPAIFSLQIGFAHTKY